jgi:hypothetical protein
MPSRKSGKGRPAKRNAAALQGEWTAAIPEEQWAVYREVIRGIRARGLPFALGGAFAVATYTGRWRNTKDLDIYLRPGDRGPAIVVTQEAGLEDLFDRQPYVLDWIYRAHRGEIIVDLIWGMANDRAHVDDTWLTAGPTLDVHGEVLRIVPPEEMIWAKLYVLEKDRCDWPDIFNILHAQGERLDWNHLLDRLGGDLPLLQGALAVFAWLGPGSAQKLPAWLWPRLGLAEPQPHPSADALRSRADLLDTRPWFAPLIEEG